MHRLLTGHQWRTAGVFLVWGMATLCMAAPINPDTHGKNVSPAERIRKELDQTITIEFADQPLHLALNQLREQTKINFVLDRQTLAQMNIDPDQSPIQSKFKDVKVRSVLRSIVGTYNLGYAIIGDTVFVSSDDMAMLKQMQQARQHRPGQDGSSPPP